MGVEKKKERQKRRRTERETKKGGKTERNQYTLKDRKKQIQNVRRKETRKDTKQNNTTEKQLTIHNLKNRNKTFIFSRFDVTKNWQVLIPQPACQV